MKNLLLSSVFVFLVCGIAIAASQDREKVVCCCENCACEDCKCEEDCVNCNGCKERDECHACEYCSPKGDDCCNYHRHFNHNDKHGHRRGGCHRGGRCC